MVIFVKNVYQIFIYQLIENNVLKIQMESKIVENMNHSINVQNVKPTIMFKQDLVPWCQLKNKFKIVIYILLISHVQCVIKDMSYNPVNVKIIVLPIVMLLDLIEYVINVLISIPSLHQIVIKLI